MKKGFTLLELVVVIIIIGVLATLGITQYGRMIERAKGAEARTILGAIRSSAAGFRIANSSCVGFAASNNAGLGAGVDQIPGVAALGAPTNAPCRVTNYFSYGVVAEGVNGVTLEALRCVAPLGKAPQQATAGQTLRLTIDFVNGTDNWTGTGGY